MYSGSSSAPSALVFSAPRVILTIREDQNRKIHRTEQNRAEQSRTKQDSAEHSRLWAGVAYRCTELFICRGGKRGG